MYIWIDKLSGDEPGTLQNINILNHYIGMQKIDQDAIPELRYFPQIVIGLVLLGLILGLINKKRLWITWGFLIIILGALGIYDFYLWEYDYGHNLASDAPIKIPGMVYQPPLIGSKMLLNFNATSLPHTGSFFILLSIMLVFLAYYLRRKNEKLGKT
jgi:copper chaperone NosL